MSKVAILAKLTAQAGRRDELLKVLAELVEALRALGPKVGALLGGRIEIMRIEPRSGKGFSF